MPVGSRTIAACRNADGRLQVFAVGSYSNSVYTIAQGAPNSAWDTWMSLGWHPPTGDPAQQIRQLLAAVNTDGRITAFLLRDNGRCERTSQRSAGGPDWDGWQDIGAVGWEQIAIATNADGRLELFGVVGGDVYHTWQTSPGGDWSASASFGAVGWSDIAVERNADGRLELFGLIGGNVGHVAQTAPNSGWGPGASFGAVGWEQIAIGANADGRLELFGVVGGDVYHTWQTSPGGDWSASASFGAVGWGEIAVTRNGDGRLEMFGLVNGDVVHVAQTAPNNGWGPGASLNTQRWTTYAVAQDADGRLELFGLVDGGIADTWQQVPGADWSTSWFFPDPEPAPHVTLTASPSKVMQGHTSTLSWTATNTYALDLEPGIGSVQNPAGSRVVTPPDSGQQYIITAWGTGGVTSDTARVDVDTPPPPPPTGSALYCIDLFMDPSNPSENEAFQVTFTYRNVGPDPSPAFDVALQIDGGEPLSLRQGPMPAGTQNAVGWQVPGLSAAGDPHWIKAVVDSRGEVNNPNRANDGLERVFSVG